MMTLNETSVVHLYSKDTHPTIAYCSTRKIWIFGHLLSDW